MNVKLLAHGVGYTAVAAALLAAASALNNRRNLGAADFSTEPAPTTSTLDAALALCKAIGPEAVDDALCNAVWEANRQRFFQSGKRCRERVTGAVVPASDSKEPRPVLGGEAPRSTPQTAPRLNSSAPRPLDAVAGQL